MSATQRQPRAFVLLWTLALLALAAVALTGLTRRSARNAVEAVEAQDQLQRKWAMASTRKLLLQHAESLLSQVEQQRYQPTPTIWLDGVLGDAQMEVRLADEQAKLNLNALYALIGPDQTQSHIRQMLKDPSGRLRVELHPDPRVQTEHRAASPPTTAATNTLSIQPVFRCWSQVFAPENPALLFSRVTDSPTDQFTCWGDGRLNLRRASDAALMAILKPQLSAASAQNLIRARSQNPSDSPDQLIAAARLSPSDRQALALVTTPTSSCYSVALHLRISRRDCYEFAVFQKDSSSDKNGDSSTQPSSSAGELENRYYRMVW